MIHPGLNKVILMKAVLILNYFTYVLHPEKNAIEKYLKHQTHHFHDSGL